MALKGILLINLGSPDSPEPKDVRRYLNQFLLDPYVIDLPMILRYPLIKWIISPRRSHSSGEAYASIWTTKGSPLVQTTRDLATKLQAHIGPEYEVRWAMRYGNPSLSAVLKDWSVSGLLIIPLYPQYAESSTRTAIEEAEKYLPKGLSYKAVVDFFDDRSFIQSQILNIQEHIDRFKPDHLLLSYHGLPEHHLTKMYPRHCLHSRSCCDQVSDANRFCYRAQCMATSRAIIEGLKFPSDQVSISFQSRLGRRPWIKPYTDHIVPELPRKGIKRLSVASPSFVADCLETLEEIQMRLRDQFIEAGGEELRLIPALNAQERWVKALGEIIKKAQGETNALPNR